MSVAKLDKELIKPFATENTILVTNTLLQFLLVGIVNLYYIAITDDVYTYTLSMISLLCALNISILFPATFERNRYTRGRYFASSDNFNTLGQIAAFSTCIALTYEIAKRNYIFAIMNVCITIVLLINFYSKRVDADGYCYSTNNYNDATINSDSSLITESCVIVKSNSHQTKQLLNHVPMNSNVVNCSSTNNATIEKNENNSDSDSDDVTSTEEEVTN